MPRLVFDTRFFTTSFYSRDPDTQSRTKKLVAENKERYVSTAAIHELYLLTLAKEGREVARLRLQTVRDLFHVVDITEQIAVAAAELRHKYRIPMGDGLIAATCKSLDARCVTDDPHFASVREIRTLWL